MHTVSEIIDAFGGTSAMARLFAVTPAAVSNWRAAGRFPPRLHYRISRAAGERGIAIDAVVFDGDPPSPAPVHEAAA